MKRFTLYTIFLLAPFVSYSTPPDGFIQTQIQRPDGSQWNEAVAMAFDPIGRLWVVERGGKIWIVDDENPHGAAPVPFLDISGEVGSWHDHGMLGMVLDPRFNESGYVYVFYVVDRHHLLHCSEPPNGVGAPICDGSYDPVVDEYYDATIGRITRYRAIRPNGENDFHHAVAVDYASRKVLVGESMNSGFPILYQTHGVGTLLFGEDDTLLASFGDGAKTGRPDRGSTVGSYFEQALQDGIIQEKENIGAYRAQMVDSLDGKVIRIDPETGDGLHSNPFFDENAPRSARSRVWAIGLRNPFRVTLRPQSGDHLPSDGNPGVLYIGDVGYQNYEELNVADRAGLNFGWPLYEGMVDQYKQDGSEAFPDEKVVNLDAPNPFFNLNGCAQEYFHFSDLIRQDTLSTLPLMNPCGGVDPIPSTIPSFTHRRPVISWFQDGDEARWSSYNGITAEHPLIGQSNSAGTKTVTGSQFRGNASAGGAWYTASEFPEEYRNTFFLGDYGGQWIRNIVLDDNNEALAIREFDNDVGGVVAIVVHPIDGDLYYISWATFLSKIVYAPTGNQPPIAVANSGVNYGLSPLPIQFSSGASFDPEDQPLTYLWNFDDGTAMSSDANPQHTFSTADGSITNFTVTLTVTDSGGESDKDTVLVSLNNFPPTISNVIPNDGTPYPLAGNTRFLLIAEYSDNESPTDQLSCEWQTILHHDNHTHDEPIDTKCESTAIISPLGCGFETFYYHVHFKISDPHGLSSIHTSQLNPNCSGQSLLPVITLTGANPQLLTTGTPYTELGATAKDFAGVDLIASIVIDASDVNISAIGNYSVTYDVNDSAGNAADTVTRTVIVQNPPASPPVAPRKSGGGSMGVLGLLFLLGLTVWRRRYAS